MRQPSAPLVAWIARPAVGVLAADHVRYAPDETGGVLLGYWGNVLEVVITEATSAGLGAEHSQARYAPDSKHDASEIARIYEQSGRIHAYLGDWHSHPAGSLGLSRRDRRTLARIGRHEEARAAVPLMAILASESEQLTLAIWALGGHERRRRVVACQVRLYGKT